MSDDRFEVPPIIRQGELVEEISALIPRDLDASWTEITLKWLMLSKYAEEIMTVRKADGSEAPEWGPREINPLFKELRKVMYRPGSGTWFSATWKLTKDDAGQVSADLSFNYDDEPDWDDPINPGLYGIDYEDFPRDEDHIPGWLRERLAEAEQNAK